MNRGGGHVGALRSFLKSAVQFVIVLMTTLIGLAAVTFFIGRVVPIDPVLAIVGDRAPPQVYERARAELGLDRPLAEQFVIYLKKAVTGDFGNSVLTTNPVMQDIANVFPATLELATLGTLLRVTTTAEGVETEDQLQAVKAEGISQIQGYLVGYPCPIEEVRKLLLPREKALASA